MAGTPSTKPTPPSSWEKLKTNFTGSNLIIWFVTALWGAYNLAPLFHVNVKQPAGLNAIFTVVVSALVVDKARKKDPKNGNTG